MPSTEDEYVLFDADCEGNSAPAWQAMGKHIMEKTSSTAAVQRQLGRKNAVYSMQYSRITADELRDVINSR